MNPFDAQYNDIRNKIIYYANRYGINPNIFIWQIWYENKFRSTGCSGAGACGIAQFIASTANDYGVNRNDVDSSLDGAARYMRDLLRLSYINGRYDLALAAYNAGQGSVKKYGGIPPFTETKNYVSNILNSANAVVTQTDVNNTIKNNQNQTGQNIPFIAELEQSGFSQNTIFLGGAILLFFILT
jgi:soluble lytic murein transglycosylase-like protein